jgi:hypothetical protein
MPITSEQILIALIATAALALLLTDLWLGERDYRYSKLVQKYECGYSQEQPCEADFDGDGHATHIEINARANAPIELPPRFVGSRQELMRLNIFSQDNTSRTHLAVRTEAHPARLLIYDGASRFDEKLTLNVAYAWNGEELVESTPDAIDRQILAGMAARDDTGTLNKWVIYWLLRWPLRIAYVLLFFVIWLLYRRGRRAETLVPKMASLKA